MTSCRLILYSSFAIILSALMLPSFFSDIALGIPNRYFGPNQPPISNAGTTTQPKCFDIPGAGMTVVHVYGTSNAKQTTTNNTATAPVNIPEAHHQSRCVFNHFAVCT
jgi:hypothetical protein